MTHHQMFLISDVPQLHVIYSLFGRNILPVSLILLRGISLNWKTITIKQLFFQTVATNTAFLLACGVPATNDAEQANIELQ